MGGTTWLGFGIGRRRGLRPGRLPATDIPVIGIEGSRGVAVAGSAHYHPGRRGEWRKHALRLRCAHAEQEYQTSQLRAHWSFAFGELIIRLGSVRRLAGSPPG